MVREGTCRPRVRVDDIARPGSVVLGGKRRVFSSSGWLDAPPSEPPSEGWYGGGASKGFRLCFSGVPIVRMWKDDDGLDAASILMEIVKRMLWFVWDSRHFKQDFGACRILRLLANEKLENVFA